MKWHLIATVGPQDRFAPELTNQDPRILLPFNDPTSPWRLGNDTEAVLLEDLSFNPSPVVRDLLRMAVAVYCTDLRIPRSRTDDRWTRELILYLPVSNPALWQGARSTLVQLLNFLSGDHWDVVFRQGEPVPDEPDLEPVPFDVACLFSGGLDSLVGAIDLLGAGKRPALVSHHGLGDGAKKTQKKLISVLEKAFDDELVYVPFYVHPEKGNTKEVENTMRARSILFVAMGIATATGGQGKSTLYVPENGLISLNVPLTHARIGSSSTRTTHPHYVDLYRKLLQKLGVDVDLVLPYRHKTKGEMLKEVKDSRVLGKTASLTMSCSHPTVSRWAGQRPGTHCGYCVPCIIRFASLHAAGIDDEPPTYDIFNNPPSDESDSASDLRAFRIGLERFRGTSASEDIFSILKSGPIPAEEARAFAAVYRRGMLEVADYLNRTDD